MRRSMLFLPGNAPNMIINGGTLRADSVILDLEDSVAPSEKDAARILVRNALRTVDFGCETIVRINSLDSEFCEEDLKEIVPCAPGAIMPPKSSRREDILRLDHMIERIEEEVGEKCVVVATGGLAGSITPYCKRDIVCDDDLLLKGLWYLYQKNK